jgi:hypothetical protein
VREKGEDQAVSIWGLLSLWAVVSVPVSLATGFVLAHRAETATAQASH